MRLLKWSCLIAFLFFAGHNISNEIDGITDSLYTHSSIPTDKGHNPEKFRNIMTHNWLTACAPLILFFLISYLCKSQDKHNIFLP